MDEILIYGALIITAIGLLFIFISIFIVLGRMRGGGRANNPGTTVIMQAAPAPAPQPAPPITIIKEEKPHLKHAPASFFTLSRYDVIDYINVMQEDKKRFPVEPSIKLQNGNESADFLNAGDCCFGMMFERDSIVFNFILRMSADMVKQYKNLHLIQRASSEADNDWYNLIIDRSFKNKKEVYNILDESYDYTVKEYGQKNAESIKEDSKQIENMLSKEIQGIDKSIDAAKEDYRAQLEDYKAHNYSEFKITRKEIAEHYRALNIPELKIVERPKSPQLPSSIAFQDRVFVMMYGTEDGVYMILRISDDYAESLAPGHPEICRARFPKGANWYQLPIDGAFSDKESVYAILDAAKDFVGEKPAAEPRIKKSAGAGDKKSAAKKSASDKKGEVSGSKPKTSEDKSSGKKASASNDKQSAAGDKQKASGKQKVSSGKPTVSGDK